MKKERTDGYLTYTILRKNVRNIRIRVTGACEIVVSAPLYVPEERIVRFVESNRAIIKDSLDNINRKRSASYPSRYAEGENFLYLGERATISVSTGAKAVFDPNTHTLYLPVNSDSEKRKAAFTRWAKRQALSVFNERARYLIPLFSDVVKKDVSISVKNMLTRWGSINIVKQTINLSIHLLRCEPELIDYIITHELCHLKYRNHSKAFYKELERFFPERKKLDKKLNEYGLVDFW